MDHGEHDEYKDHEAHGEHGSKRRSRSSKCRSGRRSRRNSGKEFADVPIRHQPSMVNTLAHSLAANGLNIPVSQVSPKKPSAH